MVKSGEYMFSNCLIDSLKRCQSCLFMLPFKIALQYFPRLRFNSWIIVRPITTSWMRMPIQLVRT